MKVRLVATYMVLLVRLVLPALIAAYRAVLRNQPKLVAAVFAFIANSISLSSLSGKAGKAESEQLLLQSSSGEPERCVTCDVLHDPGTGAVRADVIFIHGLHGSLYNTWRQGQWKEARVKAVPLRHSILDRFFGYSSQVQEEEQEQEDEDVNQQDQDQDQQEYSRCWPRDWLPLDCPGVRVIALNYTTDPFLWRPLWMKKRNRTCLLQRSREMMEHLQKLGVGDHPIVWVGHSKGGLFVKQMLVDAFERDNEPLTGLYRNTKGIMFYSVPHSGSACADINLPLLRQSVELTEVQKDCPGLLELHTKFLSMVESKELQAEIFSFTETVQTFMRILYIQIVAVESADAGIGQFYGVPLDHRNICKPTNRQCFLYKELTNLINQTV
ncbi:protein SERAC1 isoform X2 [Anabrus simplex]